MANWFKLYETDLDETRMRYALTKLPEVWPVWTGILMECCRHSDSRIKWGSHEQELFGFSDRLKISIPKINMAISILCEINYIKKGEGVLNVLKWKEKQNDYLQRKSRGYWNSRRITVNHSESPLRREERRGDKKLTTKGAPKLSNGKWELTKGFEEQLGGQWVNDAGKWVNRIKEAPKLLERVLAELSGSAREGRIKTSPAQYAEQIWKEFSKNKQHNTVAGRL